MKEKGIYFAKPEIYAKIRANGGEWNDSKERPIVCLIKSSEHPKLYWAIPMGMFNHRDRKGKDRLYRYMNKPKENIESCYYHIGRTTTKSIFFISDAIPITEYYVDREYTAGNNGYVIKNSKLILELEEKLKRILNYEYANPNHFRQNITNIKEELLRELREEEFDIQHKEIVSEQEIKIE